MFADFKIVDGDFLKSAESLVFYTKPGLYQAALYKDEFLLSEQNGEKQEKLSIPFSAAIEFQEIDIERVNAGDAALLGIIGGIALGPLGLLAGGALGGLNKKKLFVIKFKDGKKLIGKTGKVAYKNLKEAFVMRELTN